LQQEDGWSFLVKLHALVEAATTHALVAQTGIASAKEFFSRFELSGAKTGKIALAEALEMLTSEERRFIRSLSEMRNVLVHDVKNVGVDLAEYFSALPKDKRKHYATSFCYVDFNRPTEASVIHVSSIAGLEGGWPVSGYSPAKAALISHSKATAIDLAPYRIRVNAVAPGSIEFPGGAWEQMKEKNPDWYGEILESIPSGRFGTAEEVANAVVFLASDRASWITGACLVVDGGEHRGNF